jgi:hypothetical protein
VDEELPLTADCRTSASRSVEQEQVIGPYSRFNMGWNG